MNQTSSLIMFIVLYGGISVGLCFIVARSFWEAFHKKVA